MPRCAPPGRLGNIVKQVDGREKRSTWSSTALTKGRTDARATRPFPTSPGLDPTRLTSRATTEQGRIDTSVWRVEIDRGTPATANARAHRVENFVVVHGTATVVVDGVRMPPARHPRRSDDDQPAKVLGVGEQAVSKLLDAIDVGGDDHRATSDCAGRIKTVVLAKRGRRLLAAVETICATSNRGALQDRSRGG